MPALSPTLVAGRQTDRQRLFTRTFNSVNNSFDLLLLDHPIKVLSTVHTARNVT